MSLGKIEATIAALREERYRWTPVRRTYIEKKGSAKKRPLGLPTWSDKLLQEVIRLLLEAYYEPQFSDRSHGFRPGRGCHTALLEIYHQWHGTVWFVEGDIADCFGSLDHSIMRSILAEKIHDGRFLRLIDGLLQAGYLEDWRYHRTLSGAPQGGVVTPPTQWATSSSMSIWSIAGWRSFRARRVAAVMAGSILMAWFVAVGSMPSSLPSGSTPPRRCWMPGCRRRRRPARSPRSVVSRYVRHAGMWSGRWCRDGLECPSSTAGDLVTCSLISR
jgi:hypothetical protein